MRPTHDNLAGLLDNWRNITARADAFFEQVMAGCSQQMRCGAGCDACCQQDLELLPVEALALLLALEELPAAERSALASAAAEGGAAPCALLDSSGRCSLYSARPLLCRTHGLPVLYSDPDTGEQSLSLCELNFVGQDPPAEAMLDGTLLTTALAVADDLVRQVLNIPEPVRVPISEILIRGWDSFPAGGG